jgi:glycosyltransferase involved in cell wall biosynthesis
MVYKHGDIINGYEYLPKEKRKTILLLSDDMRMSSGVGTVSREIVIGTAHHYNWVQVGGAINHPEQGRRVDISQAVNEEIQLTDSSVIVYPFNGYGNIDFVRWLIDNEKIDAILPYTDPRFWGWLFNHEHELRQRLPILFYHVWDDLPFPKYNEHFYESCDWIGCISKQTYNIVKNVWKKYPPEPWQVSYVPHGIPERLFYPVTFENPGKKQRLVSGNKVKNDKGEMVDEITEKYDYEILVDIKKQFFRDFDPEFVLLYINRNVRRKMTSDIILAYDKFVRGLPEEKQNTCVLLMHTQPTDEAGTNLYAVIDDLGIKGKIIISEKRIEPKLLNAIFNIADVTINIASNEGFGLGTAESLMVGTPIIVNVTGGLQDQCGFVKDDGSLLLAEDYNSEFGSNHNGVYKKCGDWVKPIFPATISLQGSIPTPYIFDDRVKWEDVAVALREFYDMGRDERKRRGLLGREYMFRPDVGMVSSAMCSKFMDGIDTTFKNWKPRKKFKLYKV